MTINDNAIFPQTTNCWPNYPYTYPTSSPTFNYKWAICSYCKGEGRVGCCAGCTCLTNAKTCGMCAGSGKVKNETLTPRTPYITWNTTSTARTGIDWNQLFNADELEDGDDV